MVYRKYKFFFLGGDIAILVQELNTGLLADLTSYSDYLSQASKSDQVVQVKLQNSLTDLYMIDQTREHLDNLVPVLTPEQLESGGGVALLQARNDLLRVLSNMRFAFCLLSL